MSSLTSVILVKNEFALTPRCKRGRGGFNPSSQPSKDCKSFVDRFGLQLKINVVKSESAGGIKYLWGLNQPLFYISIISFDIDFNISS
jgi:hypothetical protein